MQANGPEYHFYVAERGNVYMLELAVLLRRAVQDLGRRALLHKGGIPEQDGARVNVIVAPHEFFHFFLVAGWTVAQVQETTSAAICITTEQPGTSWFDSEVNWCRDSPLILDINRLGATELAHQGLTAEYLQLGYHESMDYWRGDGNGVAKTFVRTRHKDLAVLAAMTERRLAFLARACPILWDREFDIRLFTFETPITDGTPGFLSGSQKWAYLADTKVLLNVHRSEFSYFEWLRVVEAIANGCLVVTESSFGHQPLIPFEHFVQAPLSSLAEYAAAALVDEQWRSSLADAAYEFCRSELDMVKILRDLLPEIEDAACSAGSSHRSPDSASAGGTGEAQLQLTEDHLSKNLVNATVIRASEHIAVRNVEAIQSNLKIGQGNHEEPFGSPSFEGFVPEVSVILTSHNDAPLVSTAMASVMASCGVRAELIVVDDHSLDDSVEIIRRTMDDHPWFPTLLVTRDTNHGLSNSRNVGFRRARSDYVFVLGADGLVYPNGIKRLLVSLTDCASSCAMSYGIIDCFTDEDESVGLLSCLPWEPHRLTRSKYIDDMALVRKGAWLEAGGYDERMDQHPRDWGALDLWLRFAKNGLVASFVASPVARRRVDGDETSMPKPFDSTTDGVMAELRGRYPELPWLSLQGSEFRPVSDVAS